MLGTKIFHARPIFLVHPMNGTDRLCSHFISNLGGHEVTASLITLGTPHHGSAYGQWIVNKTEAIGLEQFFKAKVQSMVLFNGRGNWPLNSRALANITRCRRSFLFQWRVTIT